MTGRPTLYTEEVDRKICELVSDGYPLYKIGFVEGMPKYSTVKDWQRDNKTFSSNVARAKENMVDKFAEEIITIADEDPGSTERGTDTGKVQHNRLRVDTRKWVAERLMPKKYGNRQIHSGDEDDPIRSIQTVNIVRGAEKPSPDQPEEAGDDT